MSLMVFLEFIPCIFFALHPQRISPSGRIRHILITINPPQQPYQVLLSKLPRTRIIIPVPIIMQPGFFIIILALEPDIIFYLLNFFPNNITINLIPCRPNHLSFPVSQLLRRSQVIQVVKVALIILNKTKRLE